MFGSIWKYSALFFGGLLLVGSFALLSSLGVVDETKTASAATDDDYVQISLTLTESCDQVLSDAAAISGNTSTGTGAGTLGDPRDYSGTFTAADVALAYAGTPQFNNDLWTKFVDGKFQFAFPVNSTLTIVESGGNAKLETSNNAAIIGGSAASKMNSSAIATTTALFTMGAGGFVGGTGVQDTSSGLTSAQVIRYVGFIYKLNIIDSGVYTNIWKLLCTT